MQFNIAKGKKMNKKRLISGLLLLVMLFTTIIVPTPVSAAENSVYITDENGTTCTGDFDSLVAGQIIFYPAEMMENNETYPVIAWANGTMCAPGLYYELLSQVAAGGYIVITNTNVMSADGKAQIGSIDHIIALNNDSESVFYNRVNTERIGVAGHSQGGRSSVNAAVADNRIDCVFSIAGSNFKSEAENLKTPTFFATGSLDSIVMPAMWVKPAYKAADGIAVYASLQGAIHTTCVLNPSAYSDYMISWFDAFLKDDMNSKSVFMDGGKLSQDSDWGKYASKNW